MRDRLIQKFTKAKKGSLGYTLTEMLVVIGIIVVLLAVAIPSVMAISKALRFRQHNDYAKSIFMAAQANLTEMRSDGGLAPLQGDVNAVNSQGIPSASGFPVEEYSDEYVYTASDLGITGSQRDTYALVLPAGSVDGTLREAHVIIEYNPITGNVFSVFYCEDDLVKGTGKTLLELYNDGALPRDAEGDKELRKDMMVGYYDGSGLSSSHKEPESTNAEVVYVNGEEGLVTVKIPMPRAYYGKHAAFMESLQVDLTVTGERGGQFQVRIKSSNNNPNAPASTLMEIPSTTSLDVDGITILVTCSLDSLADYGSFANLSTQTYQNYGVAAHAATAKTVAQLQLADFDGTRILPGDNVTVRADVRCFNSGSNPAVTIRPGVAAGINPMFEYLQVSPTDETKYILGVANGRNMQNLNAIHPDIARNVESVVFTSDIYWNQTVAYYNNKYGHSYLDTNTDGKCDSCNLSMQNHGAGKSFASAADEAPARALPYFVPIHNATMFGTAKFIYPTSSMDSFWDWLESWLGGNVSGNFNPKVPTLTDELDVGTHTTIAGYNFENEAGNHAARIYYLNIDTTRYPVGKAYYAGTPDADQDRFTGLFGYVNTSIDNLEIVNPIIKGYTMSDNNNPATGALVGAAGYNTVVTNCGVYIDTTDPDFSRAAMTQTAYNAETDQTWYGVSGEGAVGGLVGYAKSHRTVRGDEITNDDYLSFSNSFAAVNVSGRMRGVTNKGRLYGYSNGVGGFIGNSQLTNFYNCYSSGNVLGYNYYVTGNVNGGWYSYFNLYHNGKESFGTGGFVGTSHGTRYTNCFATGDVNANGSTTTTYSGAGGFVGLMCYDETFAYGHDVNVDVAQHTVFTDCYAVGLCNTGKGYLENFSGANARIKIDLSNLSAFYTGDYYKLLAPYYLTYKRYPNYETRYIFKDSYYLSQYGSDASQDNSNKCSAAASYDTLTALHTNYRNNDWIKGQLDTLKALKLDQKILEVALESAFSGDWKTIWDLITAREHVYGLYFEIDDNKKPPIDLDQIYLAAYNEGFKAADWESATAATTHSYALNAAGSVYPFSKLTAMDYYGDWPNKPLASGLAYYETYEDGTTGFYFDRDITSTLKHDQVVVSDGYAILTTGANDPVTITINNNYTTTIYSSTNPVTLGSVDRPGANSYHYAFLPAEALQAASATEFYTKIVVTVDRVTYTMYFNPRVALTQVNPLNGHAATKPDVVPTQIYVRSARQFAALGTMENFWTDQFNYVQQLNIDADKYIWGATAETDVVPELTPIGNAQKTFNGKYTATGGYVTQAELVGFLPGTTTGENAVTGLFGVIGETGAISDLKLRFGEEEETSETVTIQSTAKNAGILAGVSAGTIDNVDVDMLDQIVLQSTADNGRVGLLAGAASGEVSNCDISAENSVAVNATYAGSAIGYANNLTVNNCTLLLQKGENAALIARGTYLGGFAGWLENTAVTDVNVTVEGMHTEAEFVGGFAANITGGSVTTLHVNLTDKAENVQTGTEQKPVYLAGVCANVNGKAQLVDVSTDLDGNLSAENAAGMFGIVGEASIRNTDADLRSGTITGKVSAAGIMILADKDAMLENMEVQLDSTQIHADQAAGFAVDFRGQTMGIRLILGDWKQDSKAKITGKMDAAGFACSVSGNAGNITIGGAADIFAADKAAGFAVNVSGTNGRVAASGVTPALQDNAAGYLTNSNSKLTIQAAEAALFVLNVEKSTGSTAGIYNCYALGTVKGTKVYGFAGTNAGIVDGCTSNVTFDNAAESQRYAFVGTNSGTVSNSYGWYGDGTESNYGTVQVVPTDDTGAYSDSGKYFSCYFVDIDVPQGSDEEDNGNVPDSVVLFDINGMLETMMPEGLTGSILKLNGAEGNSTYRWQTANGYDAYPYTSYRNNQYLYPMLRVHRGNWVTTPQYAFGIGYYEKYVDDSGNVSWMMRIEDLSEPEHTVEDALLSGLYTGTGKATDGATFANNANIAEAGYLVFVKAKNGEASADPFGIDGQNGVSILGEKLDIPGSAIKADKPNRYGFFKLKGEGNLTIKSGESEKTATLLTYFADTVNQHAGPYKVRTADQLANIVKMPGADLVQDHVNIVIDAFETVSDFSGNYDAKGYQITASGDLEKGWMSKVSGTVKGLKLSLMGINAPVFGTVEEGAKVALNSLTMGSIGKEGAAFSVVNGTLNCSEITVAGDVAGKLIGAVGANATTDLSRITVNGNVAQNAVVIGTAGKVDKLKFITISGTVDGTVIGTLSGVTVEELKITTGLIGESGTVFNLISGAQLPKLTFTYPTDGNLSGTFVGKVENAGRVVLTNNLSLGTVNTLFGDVNGNVTTQNITVSAVTGKLFNDVSGTVTTGNITVKGAVDAQLFGDISGKAKVGAVSTGEVNGQIFGNVTSNADNKLIVDSITTNGNAVSGKLFKDVSNAKIGTISTGAVAGQIFGDVSGEVETGDITLVAVEKVPVETEPTSEPAESSTPAETTEPQYKDEEVPQTLSGQIFGDVSGEVKTGKITVGAVSGKLFGEVAGNVTVSGIKTGAANSSLITKLTSGTMTTGGIEVASLGAPLVGTFGNATLQGAATAQEGATEPAVITVADSTANGFLFSQTVAGAVKNYTITLNTLGAGLTNELSGTMNNVALTVNGDLAVDVINKFTNTSTALDGLTVRVNGNMRGHLIYTAAGTVKNLNLTVTGNMTADVITTAAAVESLNVTVGKEDVNGTMSGRLLGSAASVSASSLTVNGNLAPKTGETAADVIGKVSGAVNAVEIHVTGDLTGNAVTEATSATGLTVDVDGNMSGNALGTVGDVTTLNLTVDGTLKASAIDTANGNLSGVTVEAGTVEVTTEGDFGVITAQLASDKKLTGSSVTVKNVNITVGAAGSIGGLVGVNNGTMETSTVSAALNIKAGESFAVNVGGLAGTNGGTMTLSAQSNVTINYTQSNGDSANIGGIVGLMESGSLTGTENTTVISGAINLSGTASANYVVGGAVGKDGTGATYSYVTTGVHVNDNWAVAGTVSNSMPAGKGAVGKFVGYVNNGQFSNCSANNANGLYMFLGEIKLSTATLEDDGDAATNWYTSASNSNKTSNQNGGKDEKGVYEGYNRQGETYVYAYYKATLDHCAFTHSDGTIYYQTYDNTYIYLGTEEQLDIYHAERIGQRVYEQATGLKYSNFASSDKTQEATDYFYKVGDQYFPVYVTSTSDRFIIWYTYEYTLFYKVSDTEYVQFHYSGEIDDRSEAYTDEANPVYKKSTVTFPNTESNVMYMIVTSDGSYALGGNNSAVTFSADFNRNEALYGAIWQTTGSGAKWQNKSDSRYLYLNNNNVTNTTGSTISIATSSYGSDDLAFFKLSTSGYNRTYYLRYTNGGFSANQTNSSNEFRIYQVTAKGTFWNANFILQNAKDQICVAESADGTQKLTAADLQVATIALAETNLPGETGEVPEGTEATESVETTEPTVATEPAEVTEPVTEPATNE